MNLNLQTSINSTRLGARARVRALPPRCNMGILSCIMATQGCNLLIIISKFKCGWCRIHWCQGARMSWVFAAAGGNQNALPHAVERGNAGKAGFATEMDLAAVSSRLCSTGKLKVYVISCIAFFFAATFLVRSQAGPFQGTRLSSNLLQASNGLAISQQTRIADRQSSSSCPRDWSGHLRIKSPPVEYPWVAVHEQEEDVKLLGPGGAEVKLERLGTLSLLNNTAYHFDTPLPGQYQLLVSGQPISRFYSHPADCDCPWTFNKFLSEYECPSDMAAQVRKSMIRWPLDWITEDMFFVYNGKPGVLSFPYVTQFAIVKNKLYCKPRDGQACPMTMAKGASVGHLRLFAALMHSVLRKVALPDIVFYFNHADNAIMDHSAFQPMFSPSSTDFHGGEDRKTRSLISPASVGPCTSMFCSVSLGCRRRRLSVHPFSVTARSLVGELRGFG